MNEYRKKPVVIQAIQLSWGTWDEICDFITLPWGDEGVRGVYSKDGYDKIELIIPTLEGDMIAKDGDWIIKGVKGEFYPCKPDIFEETYEKVVEKNV